MAFEPLMGDAAAAGVDGIPPTMTRSAFASSATYSLAPHRFRQQCRCAPGGVEEPVVVRGDPRDEPVHVAEPRAFEQPLLVRDPLASVSKDCVSRAAGGFAEKPRALRYSTMRGMSDRRVVEGQLSAEPPDRRCGLFEAVWILPPRKNTSKARVDGEFREEDVRRYAGLVEQQWFNPKFAFLGVGMDLVDEVEIPIVDVHRAAVDTHRSATIENGTPRPNLRQVSVPSDRSDRLHIERAAIVDREVPVAVRTVSPLRARASESNAFHTRECVEGAGYPVDELRIVAHGANLSSAVEKCAQSGRSTVKATRARG